MPKTHRLTGAEMRTSRPERRINGRLFSLSVAPGGKVPRFACVVSKKVAGKAVDRNLIKRRCRALLQKYARSAAPNLYVLVAKRGAEAASYADMQQDVTALIARL